MSLKTVMAIKSYQSQADALIKNYLLADRYIPYTSILGGIFACKLVCSIFHLILDNRRETMPPIFYASLPLPFALSNLLCFLLQVYDLTQLVSSFYFKSYLGLTKIQRVEWNNRWAHLPLSIVSIIYLVDCCDHWPLLIFKLKLTAACPLFMQSISQLCHCTSFSGQISSLTSVTLALLPFKVQRCLLSYWG